jgi:choline dehydrogenase-like flavoprotein
MINDLTGRGNLSEDAYLVVIGAGTVGLPTSVLLAQKTGAKIICLETGGIEQEKDTHPLNEVVQQGMLYKGAAHGRFRCLGGTSTRWGGALIPFQDADLSNANWPISFDELVPYVREVEDLFALEQGEYSDTNFPFDLGEFHVNRLAKWPQFKKRNVATLLHRQADDTPNLHIWLNAHVIAITTIEEGVSLIATSREGDKIEVDAKRLIIAAGAIETTRLALLMGRQNHHIKDNPALGRYFTDHISTEVAEIITSCPGTLNKIIGFRFGDKGSMRNIRFELSPRTAVRKTLPPSFTHIGFEIVTSGGFDALREFLQHLQRRRPPPLRVMFDLAINTPWLLRAIWWRFINKRLLFPENSKLIVHAVVEQIPSKTNYIRLSDVRTDQFGVPLAEIVWSVTDDDKRNVIETAKLFRKTWESTSFAKMGTWKFFDTHEIWESIESSEGIFHPTGSTRMGLDPTNGVVDRDLNLFGMPNVQLLATSVLPTGGGANPTMMLFLLAMRCIDQNCKLLKAQRASCSEQ